jgi:DNA end-binding protein Ku
MARTIWKGSLSFGLVNVPVGLYPATQDKSIHFNQFEAGTSDRIRYKKVNERTGDEVPASDIVKGFDVGGGEFVMVSEEELASAEPEKSRYIEITDFVDLGEIDPVYFRATYYLAPEGEAAGRAYGLLRRVMRESNKVGIATMVMRNKEYLVAIRPDEEVLSLETMFFQDEVRSPSRELPNLEVVEEPNDREMKMATLLIDSMVGKWDPAQYHDTHRAKVEALIEQKSQGKRVIHETTGESTAKVVDLMEALNASVAASKSARSAVAKKPRATSAAASKRSPAKAAAKKTPVRKAPAQRRKAS